MTNTIGLDQLLIAVQQRNGVAVAEVQDTSAPRSAAQQGASLEELLLNGPVMSAEQYQCFTENRKAFNTWRND